MRAWREGTGVGMAYAIALLLVLQAALLAFASGASAAPVARDQFGNVLCMPSAGGRFDPAHDRHGADASCCTLGCPMLGGPAPPTADLERLVPLRFETPVRFPRQTDLVHAAPAAAPCNARAPPTPTPT